MITPEEQRIVERAVHILGEHFSEVQVLASRVSGAENGTERYFVGCGNWYARIGMAQGFIENDKSGVAAQMIAHNLNHPYES